MKTNSRRRNYSITSTLRRKHPHIFLLPSEILYYLPIAKLGKEFDKSGKNKQREIENKQREIFDRNPVLGRWLAINAYFHNNLRTITKIIAEQGFFALTLPLKLQDKEGSITKTVYYCFCNHCKTYFARFGRKANTCMICKRKERNKKLAEQQQVRRLISEGLAPRYCEYCWKLLPNQKHRKNKKYCDQSCQQKAYHARKKVIASS